MAEVRNKKAIYAAVGANLGVCALKAVAAFATGSSAMASESVHSLVDTGNEGLLLIGLRRAQKAPDEMHPFGYGKELYFWSFLVALLIFAVGGCWSIYEGVRHVLRPASIQNPLWNYVVIGFSALFELSSLRITYREFRKRKRPRGLWKGVQTSKDPSIFTILVEDLAAVAGLLIAFLGVLLSSWLAIPQIDGVASICIGGLLVAVAWLLANECRHLLVGESLRAETILDICRIFREDPNVQDIDELLSMHLGPSEVLLNVQLRFCRDLSRAELDETLLRLLRKVRTAHPEVSRIFFGADALRVQARESA